MISEHNEIEAKLAAEGVAFDKFKAFMFKDGLVVEKYECIVGPDYYYESGAAVLRHRQDRQNNKHELTVKRRKSDGSTRDREEIDLHFDFLRTKPKDVDALLKAVGFTNVFVLTKEAHIFWVKLTPNVNATFVIYDVWKGATRETDPSSVKRFIEVEVEKGSDVTVDTAKRHVRTWVEKLQEEFKLAEPLNDSLYELYSGKKYQSV